MAKNLVIGKPFWVVGLAMVLVVAGALYWYEGKDPLKAVNSFDECAEAGYPILESYPPQCKTPDGRTFAEDIGNELEKQDLIRISNPRPNQTVESPITITGEARGYWFFEALFPVKLLDGNGNTIASGIAQAEGEWMTEDFVPFKAELTFSQPTTSNGTLVLEKDNPSGLPENADELKVPVRLGASEAIKVKVFFNNNQMDPEFSCNKVFAVEREIPKTQATARAALQELLEGPTDTEKTKGFMTSINSEVRIQELTVESGVAKVDFNEQLEFQVGGSCRVAAIRAQIAETLKQFTTVQNVVISINGRTEDILQP